MTIKTIYYQTWEQAASPKTDIFSSWLLQYSWVPPETMTISQGHCETSAINLNDCKIIKHNKFSKFLRRTGML